VRLFALPVLLSAASLSSCSAEGAVSLTGSLGSPTVVVEEKMLVTTLSGGFDVYLELGERASEGTDVSFSAFSLVRADDGAPVLAQEHLSVIASKSPPIRIEPGDNTSLHFDIGDQDQAGGTVTPMEVNQSDYAAVCGAGSVKIVGTLTDSANGERPTPLSSAAFEPGGC